MRFKSIPLTLLLAAQAAYADVTTSLVPSFRGVVTGVNIHGPFNGNWGDQYNTSHWTEYNEENIAKALAQQGVKYARLTLNPEITGIGWNTDHWEDQTSWLPNTDHIATLVVALQNRGITVILDPHPFQGSEIRDDLANNQNSLRTIFPDTIVALFGELATRGVNFNHKLILETLNEPGLGETWSDWSTVQADIVSHYRAYDSDVPILVTGNGLSTVENLSEITCGPNQIATVHYYDPGAFTHQAAPDNVGFTDAKEVFEDFRAMRDWSRANDCPVMVTETAANSHADTDDRLAYLSAVSKAGRQYGIPVIMWIDMAGTDWPGLDMEADGDAVVDAATLNAFTRP